MAKPQFAGFCLLWLLNLFFGGQSKLRLLLSYMSGLVVPLRVREPLDKGINVTE